jgi:crossover junction endodeoxyribonuclease RuvC
MRILGIDPGLSGAYALLTNATAIVDDLPVVSKTIDAAEFYRIVQALKPDVAVVERVGVMPGNGAVSMFNFGQSVGSIHAVLACAGVPMKLVTPAYWKKHFNLSSDKERSRQLAIQQYPMTTGLSRKKDDGRAEALLLARFYLETMKNAAA